MPPLQSNALAAFGAGQQGPKLTGKLKPNKQRQQQTPTPRKNYQSFESSDSIPAYARMMADPLNAPVVGKPDYNSVATNVTRIRDVYVVSTDATGQAAIQIRPTVAASYYVGTITAGGVSGWGTPTDSGYYTSIAADTATYRVLSFVVEWQPTLSATQASGRIFMGQYTTTSSSGLPMQLISSFFDDEGIAAAATAPAVLVNRPLGDVPFVEVGSTYDNSKYAINAVILAGMPAVAQQVGQLIVTRIIEMIPLGTTLAKSNARHTPCDMNDCCAAANIVGPAVNRAVGQNAYDKIVKKGLSLASTAARMYMAYSSGGASELARLIAG